MANLSSEVHKRKLADLLDELASQVREDQDADYSVERFAEIILKHVARLDRTQEYSGEIGWALREWAAHERLERDAQALLLASNRLTSPRVVIK